MEVFKSLPQRKVALGKGRTRARKLACVKLELERPSQEPGEQEGLIESPLPAAARVERDGKEEVDVGGVPFLGKMIEHQTAEMSCQFLPLAILEYMDRLAQDPSIKAHGTGLIKRGFFRATGSTEELTGKGLAFGRRKGDTAAMAEGRIDQADAAPAPPTDERAMGE
jgi:hypothetical protein